MFKKISLTIVMSFLFASAVLAATPVDYIQEHMDNFKNRVSMFTERVKEQFSNVSEENSSSSKSISSAEVAQTFSVENKNKIKLSVKELIEIKRNDIDEEIKNFRSEVQIVNDAKKESIAEKIFTRILEVRFDYLSRLNRITNRLDEIISEMETDFYNETPDDAKLKLERASSFLKVLALKDYELDIRDDNTLREDMEIFKDEVKLDLAAAKNLVGEAFLSVKLAGEGL